MRSSEMISVDKFKDAEYVTRTIPSQTDHTFHSSKSASTTDGAANQDGYPPGPYVTNMSSVNSTLMILVDLLTVW